MPSRALGIWVGEQAAELDELLDVHEAVGGTGPGRRYTTTQVNHAYLMAVAAQFQGFCRNLHSEASDFVVSVVEPAAFQNLVSAALTQGRQLDRGNATGSSIGADFGRFDMAVWDDVYALSARNRARRTNLDQLIAWRNSIAHRSELSKQNKALVAGTTPTLKYVRRWRAACDQLAQALDVAVGDHLEALAGDRPW